MTKRRRRPAAGRPGGPKARRMASDRRRKRLITTGIAAAGIAVVVGLAVLASGGAGPGTGSGSPTSWDLPRLGGPGRVHLADFRGRPTAVNFFASWCTQCEAELPGFAKVARELAGQVNFVGVNSLDDGQGLGMARQFGIDSWPLAVDLGSGGRGALHDNLGGEEMPITAFYDSAGTLLYVAPGALPEQALRAELHRLYGISP